jgi:DNA (cytosine-5)-methyltransferase 1
MYTTDGAWPALYGGEGGGHGYVVTEPNGGDRGRQLDDVAYTLKIRSGCEGGGKGALVQKDKSATLATNNDQYLFQPIDKDNVIAIDKESYSSGEGFKQKPGITVGGPCATLQAQGVPHAVCYETPPVICLQGNGIDRADTAGCNGKGWKEDTSYTLNTIDRPAVAYGLDRASFNQGQNAKFDFTVTEESQPTLTARGPGAVCHELPPRYIVRRLTPTEGARLQGFADRWGDIEQVDRFSAEEYEFWKEVRNTHARINGKKVQDYTVKQMVAWYNKLQTDSAEYKMWGNGIALPTALYVMQGIGDMLDATEMIAQELNGAEEPIEDWML